MDVEVGPLLYVFSNGFRLYRCASSGEFPYTDAANELPSWVYNEVSAVQLTNPSRTNSADWRFASNRPILIQLLQQSVDQ